MLLVRAAGFFAPRAEPLFDTKLGTANETKMTLQEITLRTVPVVEPSTSLDEVVYLMENDPLNVVVLVGDEQYMGMFTPDALANLVPPGIKLSDLAVGPYVHPVRVIGTPDMEATDALELMGRKHQSVLPVVERRVNYLGVLTLADVAGGAGQS